MGAIAYDAHPVLDALRAAMDERLFRVEALSTTFEKCVSEDDGRSIASQIKELTFEIGELSDWINARSSNPTTEEWEKAASDLLAKFIEGGATTAKALSFYKIAMKRARGRPATARPLFIAALEMKLRKPMLSWALLTKHMCPCGQTTHNENCKSRIRLGVTELSKFIERMGIQLPDEAAQAGAEARTAKPEMKPRSRG